jgi:hypothetical protein
MNILVGCEFSGIVRDAFASRGHYAVSCDLLPSEQPGHHYQGDVFDAIYCGVAWDLCIFHPPCTHLAVSGARWFKEKREEQKAALAFVRALMDVPFPYAIENPVGILSTAVRLPDQTVQPYEFGHRETKRTCLWLSRLPLLRSTRVLKPPFKARIHHEPPGPERWKNRSRTYPGIARAMAVQWGKP